LPVNKLKRSLNKTRSRKVHNRGYVLAAVLGAIGGGLVVALATRAIPRMMSQMMQNMMARMGEGEFDPSEM
jgi:hypothetical protein